MAFDHGHREEHVDDGMIMIQANLDDMSPEWCGHVADLLFEAGANDVFWIPIYMKKGRPGVMLNVLVHSTRLEAMEDIIFAETTSFGLRYTSVACHRLERRFDEVHTPWGTVRVKTGYHGGRLVEYAPEYEDCRRAARNGGVPLKMVYEEARRLWRMKEAGGAERFEPQQAGEDKNPPFGRRNGN
jgi:uncharacterized protein (DUF111 family)